MRKQAGVLAVSLVLGMGTAEATTIEITECGVTVPRAATGVLLADVHCEYRCSNDAEQVCDPNAEPGDCPSGGLCSAQTIMLERGATLELGGHTLFFAHQGRGVDCGPGKGGGCRIVGPGAILGGKGIGIAGRARNVYVENFYIDNTDTAIWTEGKLVARDLVLGGREEWLTAGTSMRLDRVVLGPAGARSGGDLVARDVDASQGSLRAAGRLLGRDVVLGRLASGRDVYLRRATSSWFDVTGAPASDVEAERRLRLRRSTVGAIESGRRPMLVQSSCEKSTVAGTTDTWGVCAND